MASRSIIRLAPLMVYSWLISSTLMTFASVRSLACAPHIAEGAERLWVGGAQTPPPRLSPHQPIVGEEGAHGHRGDGTAHGHGLVVIECSDREPREAAAPHLDRAHERGRKARHVWQGLHRRRRRIGLD